MDTIAMAEAAVASAEEAGSRGALLGLNWLRRAWPTSVCCGHCRTEAEEESDPATGVQDGTTSAVAE
jgi:hypothetical protein